MKIVGTPITSLAKKIGRNLVDTDVLGLSAQTAYYFFFSLFPLFLFAVPLLSLVGNKQATINIIMTQLAETVPPDAYRLVKSVVADVVFAKGAPGVISIGAVMTLWAGSNIFSALANALNHACGAPETRPWWKTTLIAVAFVLGATVVGLGATTVLLDGEGIVRTAANFVGLGATERIVWMVMQFPLAITFVVLLTWAAYYFLPNVRLAAGEALLGAGIATVLWLLVTLIFRLYVQHFGSFNEMYGTIGAAVILLIWMYLTMLSVLVGGVVAAEVHGEREDRGTPGDPGRRKRRERHVLRARR